MLFRTLFIAIFALVGLPVHADNANCPMNLDFTKRYLASDESVRLCDAYADQVLLVVNTASYCGFTSQFAGLEGETAAASVHLQNDPDLAERLLWSAGCGGDINLTGLCLRILDWKPTDRRWMSILEQPLRLWRLHPHRKHTDFDRTVYPRIFKMILDHGADPNVVGRFGYRLAHRLAACGSVWNQPIMTKLERVEFATITVQI